jgi:hypothetical protein
LWSSFIWLKKFYIKEEKYKNEKKMNRHIPVAFFAFFFDADDA